MTLTPAFYILLPVDNETLQRNNLMKSLETTFTKDNHVFTQIKRNKKAALYKRETLEGAFVSYEVFAIMTKNGSEIYPNQTAVAKKWCFCPVSEARANTWFKRITDDEVAIPNVDPETGESLETVDNRSLDEMPDVVSTEFVAVVSTTPVALATENSAVTLPVDPIVEVPTIARPVETEVSEVVSVETLPDEVPTVPTDILVEVPVDETIPTVDIPTVDIPTVDVTPDGGAVVTVAKVRQNKVHPTMDLPVGEFTRTQFAILNNLKPANSESYGALMREIKNGRVAELRKESGGKGKPKSIYTAVVTAPVVTV